ncbi:MAG: FtsX-like permease family protein [Acidobacteria bacterium]|nr:FtsX-like permease family protein [Acidobacteriota bacterium]
MNLAKRPLLMVHRAITRMYPTRFRRRFGAAMDDTFEQQLERASARGPVAWTRCCFNNFRAAIVGLFIERLPWLRRRPAQHSSVGLPHERGDLFVTTFLLDLRHGCRSLRLAPGFTAAAVVTLALGIGLTTSIFSVVQAVLLRPLPYGEPSQLVAMNSTLQDQRWWAASLADVLEWRELTQSLESVAFGTRTSLGVEGNEFPEQVAGVRVSANWFDTLRVEPALGRDFAAGEDSPDSDHVAVLTDSYWQARWAGDPAVVGTTLRIDGNETTVVGILPSSYRADFWGNPQIYVTRRFTIDDAAERVRIYTAVGRMSDDLSTSAAQADADRISGIVAERFPAAMEGWGVQLIPLHEAVTGPQRNLLVILLGAVGLVLLVACANVSNLLLARGTQQARELAVRTALGASRGRLIRQLLTETAVLAFAGGGLGLLLSSWGTRALLSQAPGNIPRIDEAGVDPVVLGFTLGICLLTGLLFGLLPALRASHTQAASVIRTEDTRTATGASTGFGTRDVLVAAELALVVALLVGAGVAIRGFLQLQDVDLGFTQADRLVVPITVPTEFQYDEIDDIARFFEQVRERLAESGQVAGVGDVSMPPLYGGNGQTGFHIIEGRDYEPGSEPTGGIEMVSPGYFELMEMSLIDGRTFNDLDTDESRPIAVVNEAMARRHWGGESPVGARVRLGPAEAGPIVSRWVEVVGVVQGVRYGPEREVRPRLYVPDPQMPAPMNFRAMIVAPRSGGAYELTPLIRETVASVRTGQAIGTPRSFEDLAEISVSTRRLQSTLLGLFGAIALTLGAIGVYGVVGYAVSQRTREMGIRLALGATRNDVLRLVLRNAMIPVVLGLGVGTVLALALGGLLAANLPGTSGIDALVLAVVPTVLLATAFLASWLPARRATAVDPASSLRD